MQHEVRIYGDIVPFKWLNDGSEFDLASLNARLDNLELSEGDEILIGIHTFGGCTTTAFAIYNKLQRIKSEKKVNLTTRVDGYCASSGVIILLAGDKRIGNKYAEPFIHNAWTWTMGDKDNHKKQFEELAKVDNQISDLYAERTSIEKEKAVELMNADGFVSSEDAMSYGFFTELENVYSVENAVVFNSLRSQNSVNRNKLNKMSKNKKSAWNKLKSEIDAFFGGAQNKIVFTADNSELDFYELDEDATPAIGDKARYEGKPAGESNDGEYTMPSGEVYKFSGEELTEIVEKEEETTELETEIFDLKKEIEDLKNELQSEKDSKTEVSNKLKTATEIINKFKNLGGDFNDEEPREGKKSESTTGTAASNALSKFKKNK